MLKAALNGGRAPGSHPALPLQPDELAADAAACVRVGAGAVHIHPRTPAGLETLDPAVIDEAVRAVREATGVPIGVSTGAWIHPDAAERADLVSNWRGPDMASVNLSEDGAELVIEALLGTGIGVEAGIWSVDDVDRLVASGFATRVMRILVEIVAPTPDPVRQAMAIEERIDSLGIDLPRLIHGEDEAAWPVLQYAMVRRRDARVGLEDTLSLPDGTLAGSNAALVKAALALT